MDREQREQEIRELVSKYAKAKAERIYLDQFRKSKLAILMKKHANATTTNAFEEREARRDPEYLEVLDGLREAVETEEKSRWELKMVEMNFAVWQEKQWNERASRKRYEA